MGCWGVGGGGEDSSDTISGFIFLSKCDISLKAWQRIKVHRTHDGVVELSFLQNEPRKDA